MTEELLQLLGIELLRQRAQHGGNENLVESELQQAPDKVSLAMAWVTDLGCGDRAGNRVERNVSVGADEAAAKLDRREMTLAGGTQAHDEPQRAGRDAVLIRVRDNRGVEQCRRLQAVLAHEVGADQQTLRRRWLASRWQEVTQLPASIGEDGIDAHKRIA